MRISPNNFFLKSVMENLMKEAFIDITPASNDICLILPQQNGGKAAKKRKHNSEKLIKSRGHVVNIDHEQKVCAKALECLGYLLVYQGTLMKPVLFFLLQEKVIAVGFLIASKIQQDGELYRHPRCRSLLADLVGFLMTHPLHKMPVPINYGIALLTKLKHSDPDESVRKTADMNLYRAETAIHNKKDVFYFPPDYSELRDTLMFNKQTINKFNDATVPKDSNGTVVSLVEPDDEVEENVLSLDGGDSSDEAELVATIVEPPKEAQNTRQKPTQPALEVVEEVSDEETQEISDEDEDCEIVPPVAEKRPSSSDPTPPAVAKKSKVVASKKDDELLEEYMADFTDELV